MKIKQIYNGNFSYGCKSPYYYLSKYRSELMGLAILWVVWFHSSVQLDFFRISFINKTFSFLKDIGYGGVDVFLLVSGMGIYNSLEKNDISKYIKNRIKRITPVWWSFLIISVLLGYFFFHIHFSKLEILGFATFTGFWIDMSNQGNWYVYAIMLFYLVSPIFYSLIKNSKNRLLMTIVLIAVALLVSVPFIGIFKLIVFSRVPIFLIGMFVSSSLKNVPIKRYQWVIILLSFIVGLFVLFVFYKYLPNYLWPYGLWWYPFIVIAPTLSLLVSKTFDILHRVIHPILYLLSILGKSSLEILLVSDYLFANFSKIGITVITERITSVFVVLISIIIGVIYHFCIDYTLKRVDMIIKKLKRKK